MSFIEYQGGRMKAILAIVCMVGARKPERERERERLGKRWIAEERIWIQSSLYRMPSTLHGRKCHLNVLLLHVPDCISRARRISRESDLCSRGIVRHTDSPYSNRQPIVPACEHHTTRESPGAPLIIHIIGTSRAQCRNQRPNLCPGT